MLLEHVTLISRGECAPGSPSKPPACGHLSKARRLNKPTQYIEVDSARQQDEETEKHALNEGIRQNPEELNKVITNSMDMSLSKLPEMVKDREACHAAVHAGAKSRT